MTESEYVDLVGRVQQAMAVEPFRPSLADVVVLIAEWRLLHNENERLRTAAMKLDGYWIGDTYDPETKNVSVRESAFAELRDLLGLKPKTYA